MKGFAASLCIVLCALCIHPVRAAVDPDLRPVRVSGLGLGLLPDTLKPRLRVRLFLTNDEHDAFPELAPEAKFHVFATNELGAAALGSGGPELLDLTGATCPWLGDDPATFWVEGRIHGASASLVTEVSLDGSVIGSDAIRLHVAPFLVLSNCDVAETLFVSNIGDEPWNAFETDMVAAASNVVQVVTDDVPIAFCQDMAEFGWRGLETDGKPVIWSLDGQAFRDQLSAGCGWFGTPRAPGWGGNVEASPPTALHPHGRIVVGSNLPERVKTFLKDQEVQAPGGELLELPVSWLRVGHVDEVMAILPKGDGAFSVAVADTRLAVSLMAAERDEIADMIEKGAGELDDYLDWIDMVLQPFFDPTRQTSLANITNQLSEIRSILKSGLELPNENIISIPVLFPPSASPGGIASLILPETPNPINLVALVSRDGRRRLLVPDPISDSLRENIFENLVSNGFAPDEISFVMTAGPHDAAGEAHCASNVLRRREP